MINSQRRASMKVLALGDIIGSIGCKFLRTQLPSLKQEKNIDLVIANGENSADGNGITPASAEHLFTSGIDVITTGNHAFRRKECYELYDSEDYLLRPANYPNGAPGKGICIVDKGRFQAAVINLMGVVYLEHLNCPFSIMDQLLQKTSLPKIILVDFHAEATGEKGGFAYEYDGAVSAIFGTHTHIQTADEQILPLGTGFITDLGMTGPSRSVLGVKPELIIKKLRTKMPVRFDLSSGLCHLNGVVFEIDEKTGKTVSIERIQIKQTNLDT